MSSTKYTYLFLLAYRFSILPALSLDGILDLVIVEGAINADSFAQFIENLTLEMCLYPEKNSVVVLDNVRFHHDARIQEILESK